MSTKDEPKKVKLTVTATLYLDPEDFAELDLVEPHALRRSYEEMETEVRVVIERGTSKPHGIRGTLRFSTPDPYELKVARLDSLATRRTARRARPKDPEPPTA